MNQLLRMLVAEILKVLRSARILKITVFKSVR